MTTEFESNSPKTKNAEEDSNEIDYLAKYREFSNSPKKIDIVKERANLRETILEIQTGIHVLYQ